MQVFTIRDIEHLTGIKAHTLRIWEQRYNFFTAKRKESAHRIYNNEDLKQLLRISFLYHNGWKVSKIASLSQEQITAIVREAPVADHNYGTYVSRLIEAALDFDEHAFVVILNDVIAQIGFEDCIVKVCYPYLTKVGHLWSTNNVIPAQEHFSSYMIQNRILVETDKIVQQQHAPVEMVVLAPKGEFHELPVVFINYMLKKNGWGTVYMGTDISLEEVAEVAGRPGIQYIYVHLLTNFTGFEVDDYFEGFCKRFPDKKIIASGEGVQRMQRSFVNLTVLRADRQIYDFIERKLI